MKKKIISLISISIISWATQAQTLPIFITDSLDSYIDRNLEEWGLPGLSLAIIKDGKTVHLKGYGVRSIKTKEPVNENTRFQIASITKSFTATTLAILQEEKKLSLDDKVISWLPYFRLKDSTLTRQVDIEDLLSHRIGFGNHQGDLDFGRPPETRKEIVEQMSSLETTKKFRASYGYSNKAFVAAGEIISKVTGKSWEESVTEKIFTPLNMSRTEPHFKKDQTYLNIAHPHTIFQGEQVMMDFVPMDVVAPAGAIVSSAKDMSHWLRAQLADGIFNGDVAIPRRAIKMTRRVNNIQGLMQSKKARTHFYAYGLGYYIRDVEGYLTFQHNGGGYGFSTNHVIVPEKELAFVILTNNDVSEFYMDLTNMILDAFLEIPFTDHSANSLESYKAEQLQEAYLRDSINTILKMDLKPSVPLKAFAGTYENKDVGYLTVGYKDGKIKMSLPDYLNVQGKMNYLGNNTFLCTFTNYDYGVVEIPFDLSKKEVRGFNLMVPNFEDTNYYFRKIR
ncbi:serine hydrolase [Spongiimicrobium sp. 3-5]|uniref:serine hydrolase n=1 Tax=Spongiimicrobium sp. 3-5 TaxID=3332596 RepID=UPI0039804656